jgi:hypothetical protein
MSSYYENPVAMSTRTAPIHKTSYFPESRPAFQSLNKDDLEGAHIQPEDGIP